MTEELTVLTPQSIAALLECVGKPARYVGGEFNRVVKLSGSDVTRVVLCFPDVYEIGMSHLGLKILAHILNDRPDVWCQRCFAPWPDMEAQLRQRRIPLFSLEEHRGLGGFDIIGFSLQYELCFTNVLQMLDLAGLPIRQCERREGPLVIGGGPCCVNPEPLAAFFDALVIGEAEELIVELIECFRRYQKADNPAGRRIRAGEKPALLRDLARIPGVYVPSLYAPVVVSGTYAELRPTHPGIPERIQRRAVCDLNQAPVAWCPPVSTVEAVQDRITIEIMRGCPNQCYFCQAGFTGNPVRVKDAVRVRDELRQIYRATGYESVALCALSSAQYPHLSELVRDTYQFCREHGIAITLPSLRVDEEFGRTLNALGDLKKSVLTFAPEAGSERLRGVINKTIDIELLGAVIQQAYGMGWQRLKLYFMIGLPTETEDDLRELVALVQKFCALRTACRKHAKGSVAVSIGNFIPKPHTPFQWRGMATIDALRAKQDYLRRSLRSLGVRLSFHDPEMSFVEAYLARADRTAADTVQAAYEAGCRFDGWSASFCFSLWQAAMKDTAAQMSDQVHAGRSVDAGLPWDHIGCGVEKGKLRVLAAGVSPFS